MLFERIPAGTFTMGSPVLEPDRSDTETPHVVTISRSFYIQSTEVTQRQWAAVMGDNPSGFEECADCPVNHVSWQNVQLFLARLSAMDHRTYRLPTEAEWEYAAKAEAAGSPMPAAVDDPSPLGDRAWYLVHARGRVRPVASRRPNAWGLYDTLGNVWEWCSDRYGAFPPGGQLDPAGPATGDRRVTKGGSYDNASALCRPAARNAFPESHRGVNLGFRVVCETESP
jgi:formylglycine-generating enzyme required for sulfatase activity